MAFNKLKADLRRFGKEQEGYVTLEVAIMLPMLFMLFAASWVYFDVFNQKAINQKANYVIGDMVSRETDPLDSDYLDNAFSMFGLLTLNPVVADESDGTYPANLRISVVEYNDRSERYRILWSVGRGDVEPLSKNDGQDYADELPVMANKEQVIMVETWENYNPIFSVGLDPFVIRTYSFTRPRYAPQVLYKLQNENNGWGNGDQDAPGNSQCKNNAENAVDC